MNISFKRILKWLISAIAVGLVFAVTSLSILYFTNAGYELRSNGERYVDINISQNWGIRRDILMAINAFLELFPKTDDIQFEKNKALQGAKIEKSKISNLLTNAQRVVNVETELDLIQAIKNAAAGDFILISPGTYKIRMRSIIPQNGGLSDAPIVLAASRLGNVEILLDSLEGILISHPFWIVKNLSFQGICEYDGNCDHAIHLFGNADNTLIENNIFRNFNAPIKANGSYSSKGNKFPDFVTILSNDFYNDRLRETRQPTVAIDVVGGDNWHIQSNFIADFARVVSGKKSETYMAFMKGAGQNGVFEDNVVNCAWKIPHQSIRDLRVGLSFGNGGTGKQFCQDGNCSYEHLNGVIRKNLILNCRNDVGIYLSKSSSTKLEDNVLLNTMGIDVRFPETSASINRNILHGRIKIREGGFVSERDNIVLSYGEDPDHDLIRVILSQR